MTPYLNILTQSATAKLLWRASQMCDNYCKKRLGAPPTTTLSGPAVSYAGATTIPIDNTIGFDDKDEQAVIIGTGATQETIPIQSGGVAVTTFSGNYPGTITLTTPTQYTHLPAETVRCVYQETTKAGNSSNADVYTEALETQLGQIAMAHMPALSWGDVTKKVFLKSYPVISLITVEHAYPFNNQYNSVDTTNILRDDSIGVYKFPVGQLILPEGYIRTTYTGGYVNVPDDIKEACMLYVAYLLQATSNPFMATSLTRGKQTSSFSTKSGKPPLVEQAENILDSYRRRV